MTPSHFHRLDLLVQWGERDEATGLVRVRVRPHPDRYEWRTHEGEEYLYDKLDFAMLPKAMFEELVARMASTPLQSHAPKIPDSRAYASSRLVPFGMALDGDLPPPTFEDASDDFLRSLADGEHDFVIMSVDVVGSTRLATELEASRYARLIGALTTEFSAVVPLFHGHVLKYTGDGIIAYFPTPNFIGKNDLAIDCALTMLRTVAGAVNPALASRNLPEVALRIGLDSGTANVATLGDPATKQQKDIIGRIVSLACKIQSKAPVGGIALGDATLKALHVSWRERCEPLDAGPDWTYRIGKKPYRLHRVKTE